MKWAFRCSGSIECRNGKEQMGKARREPYYILRSTSKPKSLDKKSGVEHRIRGNRTLNSNRALAGDVVLFAINDPRVRPLPCAANRRRISTHFSGTETRNCQVFTAIAVSLGQTRYG